MYRILLLLCFTLHIDINYSQVVKTDVELTVLVSPFINETEQMLYVYQLNGNTYTIDDSVRIEPGRDSYVVHASVPYETTIRLLFSKRGPLHMQILVRPKDKITIEITEEDQKVGISRKRLLKGTPHHDAFVDFWDTINSFGNERRKAEKSTTIYGLSLDEKKQLQAIVDSCNKVQSDFERNIIMSSSSPYVVSMALNLIEKDITSDDYLCLVKTAYNRFPTYYPLQLEYRDGEWAPASENNALRPLLGNMYYWRFGLHGAFRVFRQCPTSFMPKRSFPMILCVVPSLLIKMHKHGNAALRKKDYRGCITS